MNEGEINNLKIGQVLNSFSLREIFQVANQGGMRRSRKTNSLVLVSNHFTSSRQKDDANAIRENVYTDEWKDGVFHYTGMGLKGDQDINYMQNRTINESSTNGVNLYLFEVFSKGYFTFSGKVELCGDPYKSTQKDINDNLRQVWIFPLRRPENKLNETSESTVHDNILNALGDFKKWKLKIKDSLEKKFPKGIYTKVESPQDKELKTEKEYKIFNWNEITPYKNNSKKEELLTSRPENKLNETSELSVLDAILKSLETLGGEATLNEIYIEVNKLRDTPKPSIRARIYEHSMDCDAYSEKNSDLFMSTDGKGNGKWKLRDKVEIKNIPSSKVDIQKLPKNLTNKGTGSSHNHKNIPSPKVDIQKLPKNPTNKGTGLSHNHKNIAEIYNSIFANHEYSKINDIEKIIFEKRLKEVSLKNISYELDISTESVRRSEVRVINLIMENINKDILINEINEFHEIFSISREPTFLYDFIRTVKTFNGIELMPNPEVFIKKIIDNISTKFDTNYIDYEKIPGYLPIFYSKIKSTLKYDVLFKIIEKIYKKNILKDNDQDPSTNEQIINEILKANREDISKIIFSNLKDLTSESLNFSEQLVVYFKKKDKLFSLRQALIENKLPGFGNHNFLYENDIYEFKKSGWGEYKKFYRFKIGYEEIIADRIIDSMNENPSKQYMTINLLDIIKNDLNYLSDFPEEIDEYQLNVCLIRAMKLGKPIFDLGRKYWSLETTPRKKTKHLIYEALFNLDKPSSRSEILTEVRKIKDTDAPLLADNNLENYGHNLWGLVNWRKTKPASFFNFDIKID